MRRPARKAVVGAAVTAVLLTSATAAVAAVLADDGTNLQADFVGGGAAKLELEDRNVEPVVCFIWDHPAPQDGDSFASRVIDAGTGATVVDLGTADQWIDGAGEGCEVPRDERFRDVFANPARYAVEFRVVEEQGTPATPPVRSGPLRLVSG